MAIIKSYEKATIQCIPDNALRAERLKRLNNNFSTVNMYLSHIFYNFRDNKIVVVWLFCFVNSHEKDTQFLGTPGYAAPEQFGISQSVSTADIYSMGVLLNTMLTGAHPSVDLPKGALKYIIKKCTRVQINKRYQSANALKKAVKLAAKF